MISLRLGEGGSAKQHCWILFCFVLLASPLNCSLITTFVLYPLHAFTSHALQKLTIKLTGSYHAGCQGTLGDKNALHNTNSVIKGVCSIHSRLRSVYIYLGLFLANHAHLWTYTCERRPSLVPEVTHCGQSFTYFGLRISYRSVRTVSK